MAGRDVILEQENRGQRLRKHFQMRSWVGVREGSENCGGPAHT